ncbi:UDP-N-acetylglucosamine 2-epimerase (hydrolyzing) [Echinicola marina]|uniref:UDP-N-acetylglucosamine 2-epimerase n=1 Tax=Echinicola marina TaxID=2859768 RepID=UPI001CF65764|nr:UDP-N-acetylglucosamine 2-epimerase [Echinicola marina]UCS93247.1 UDP-N-acetylglucosamine 2-epimerase (hydrolyzing) [Echinicola marina]
MKICVATGTRAEYGLLKPLINRLKACPQFNLQILVTGAHLSPEFGLTYRQIEEEGLKVDYKVEMLLSSDTAEGITKSMGLGMLGFTEAFKNLEPDLLVILGDRYEMLAMASTALIFKIPIAHIHGGEITEGAYDDAIRHAITKMSHLHFSSTESYKHRIIQMGEQPDRVFNVGAIGLDNIVSLDLWSKEELEKNLNIRFKPHNFLISFHPETLAEISVERQFENLLDALTKLEDSFFIFTKANADTNGRIINQMMENFVSQNGDKSALFDSLGSLRYLSVMKIADAVVGNSSSGIIEAPSVGTATINIGDRQKGRIQADSVLNCGSDTKEIYDLLKKAQEPDFNVRFREVENPYGTGNTSAQIVEVLKEIDLSNFGPKRFYNFI